MQPPPHTFDSAAGVDEAIAATFWTTEEASLDKSNISAHDQKMQ